MEIVNKLLLLLYLYIKNFVRLATQKVMSDNLIKPHFENYGQPATSIQQPKHNNNKIKNQKHISAN